MKKFLEIIKEEFYKFIKDPAITLIMIIGVIAYPLFYAIPYSTEVIREAPIAIVDMDNSQLSREFARNLDATDSIKVVTAKTNNLEAQNAFFNDEIKGFINIPKDFEKDIKKGKQTNLSLYVDSSYMIIYKAIYSKTMETALEMGAKIEIAKMIKQGIPKEKALAIKQPFEYIQIPLYNIAGGYASYAYPMILILIMHQTLLLGLSIRLATQNEKNEPYCENQKEIPFTIFARTSFYIILYLLYSLIFFLIYPNLINYPMSYNVIPLFLLLIPMYYSIGFLAHVLSPIYKEREYPILFIVITSLIFIFLPGLIWPKEAMPQIVNIIASLVPATFSVDGIIKINQMNATFWDIKFNFIWLIALSIFYYLLSIKIIKKKEKR